MHDLVTQLSLAMLLAGIVAIAPILWYSRTVVRPLQAFTESVRDLSTGNTQARLDAPAAVPELIDFAGAFNHALDRIDGLASELQSANDQLAHELRTPLSRIRGNLEVLHDRTDHPATRETAAMAIEEIDRSTRLVQTILTARAGDHGALSLHPEPVSLRTVLSHLHAMYLPVAEDRGLSLGLEAAEDIVLPLDKQRITQAVSNLLDNALAYTSPGNTVTIALALTSLNARLSVRDTGPGLHGDDAQRIWRRFVRGSAASALTPGMGLGLSLVRAIATAHGGTAGAANRTDAPGADFWIEVPVSRCE